MKYKDFIDWELDETLDINGWDLSKALQHFYKSNVTVFEWSNSPVVYATTPEWEEIKKASIEELMQVDSIGRKQAEMIKNYFEENDK